MGRKRNIVSPKETLRDLILKREKNGLKGVMGIEEVMANRVFNGWGHDDIRQLVQQLRKKYRGQDEGEGEEFWSIWHGVIFGLAKFVPEGPGRHITLREEKKHTTISTHLIQTHSALVRTVTHDGILHKQDIKTKIQTSDKHLVATVEASENVIDSLLKYKGEFESKEDNS